MCVYYAHTVSSIWIQPPVPQCDASDTRRVQGLQCHVTDLDSHDGQRLHHHQHSRPPLLPMWCPWSLPDWTESRHQRSPCSLRRPQPTETALSSPRSYSTSTISQLYGSSECAFRQVRMAYAFAANVYVWIILILKTYDIYIYLHTYYPFPEMRCNYVR